MMLELTAPAAFAPARPLFASLEHHLLVPNFFEGQLKAQLFVDNADRPNSALLLYNNRCLLGGDPTQAAFNADLQRHFTETVIPARKAAGSDGILFYFAPGWQPSLEQIFASFEHFTAPREYYTFDNPGPALEITPPPGYSFHLIDTAFLQSSLAGLEALREEMCSERTSVEDFLEKSFGICPVYENAIAGWCLSEYNLGHCCEIGIATLEPHQRKGLATLATRAFLVEAAKRGYQQIGWDCWQRNLPSAATARKAGFTLVEEYSAFVVIF